MCVVYRPYTYKQNLKFVIQMPATTQVSHQTFNLIVNGFLLMSLIATFDAMNHMICKADQGWLSCSEDSVY